LTQLVFDIETTPVNKEDPRSLPDTIHCIVVADVETEQMWQYGPGSADGGVDEGVRHLQCASRLIGQDIARFDIPVLEHIYKDRWTWDGEIFDTHAVSRLVYASNMVPRSIAFHRSAGRDEAAREALMPKALFHKHNLEAWGYRLEIPKRYADADVSFYERWSPELQERCYWDVQLTGRLYEHLLTKAAESDWEVCSLQSMLTESRCAYIIGQQERNGVGFDAAAAGELFAELSAERERLEKRLREAVPAWIWPKGRPKTPKRSCVRRKNLPWPVTYTIGAEYQPIQVVEFQPSSPQQRWLVLEGREARAERLHQESAPGPVGYGWRASDFTDEGQARTDEETLTDLPFPIIPDLLRYLTVAKRLGQLSDGKNAWLKCETQGRIHGAVHITGTRTSRASHFKPNLGQVPKVTSLYGTDCRRLFTPTRHDWVQVGIDAKGLELRMLAHRLARYDGGAFIETVLAGDPHLLWMGSTGIVIRDNQKTWTYAFLYGAGNEKLGLIILADWRDAYQKGLKSEPAPGLEYAEELGKDSKKRLLRHFRALDRLLEACAEAHARGWIRGLDGRILACPSEHGALNDLLQSDGTILVKHAMPIWHRRATREIGPHGRRWAQMLWVHDEHQFESTREVAEPLGGIVCDAITEAGLSLGVRCRMDGQLSVGKNWAETH